MVVVDASGKELSFLPTESQGAKALQVSLTVFPPWNTVVNLLQLQLIAFWWAGLELGLAQVLRVHFAGA